MPAATQSIFEDARLESGSFLFEGRWLMANSVRSIWLDCYPCFSNPSTIRSVTEENINACVKCESSGIRWLKKIIRKQMFMFISEKCHKMTKIIFPKRKLNVVFKIHNDSTTFVCFQSIRIGLLWCSSLNHPFAIAPNWPNQSFSQS